MDKVQLNIIVYGSDKAAFDALRKISPLKTPALFHEILKAYEQVVDGQSN